MRFYFRTGRNSGVSVGIIGALVLLVLVAAVWFYVALFVAAVVIVAGLYAVGAQLWERRKQR